MQQLHLVGFTKDHRGLIFSVRRGAKRGGFVVDVEGLHHKNPVSPYDGRELAGVVRGTWLRGRPIDFDAAPRGRLLTRA